MQRVMFVPKAKAIELAGNPDWAVISITSPGDDPVELKPGWAAVLRLAFVDADRHSTDGELFSDDMAAQVIAFAQQAISEGRSVLVHCLFGVSRSAAVAVALSEYHGLPAFIGEMPLNSRYTLYNKHVYRALHKRMSGY